MCLQSTQQECEQDAAQLRSCHGAHTREEQEHADEDLNSNDNI